MSKEEIDNYLDQQDPELVKAVMARPKTFITIYNRMCRKCKQLVHIDSKRPMDDYCIKCKMMMRKILE